MKFTAEEYKRMSEQDTETRVAEIVAKLAERKAETLAVISAAFEGFGGAA
jgi:PHD/YefM family antitoxin component YafN of YafNO toxin-antitoxin module